MPRHARPLTDGERALAASMFHDAIDYDAVRLSRSKWAFFQPRETVMAPTGSIHFHPRGTHYRDDFVFVLAPTPNQLPPGEGEAGS